MRPHHSAHQRRGTPAEDQKAPWEKILSVSVTIVALTFATSTASRLCAAGCDNKREQPCQTALQAVCILSGFSFVFSVNAFFVSMLCFLSVLDLPHVQPSKFTAYNCALLMLIISVVFLIAAFLAGTVWLGLLKLRMSVSLAAALFIGFIPFVLPLFFTRDSYASGRTAEYLSLSRCEHSSCSVSFAGSGPPLLFQDKGVEALHCAVNNSHFPPPADDATMEKLFPKDEWMADLYDTGKKSESKLNILFEKQTKEALELAKSVFVKPKKELCHPKIPDFVLVDKESQEVPTPDTVGALLFAQSTTESSKSYAFDLAVGEAVAVAQVLLRNTSQHRQFIMTGVTNVKKIRWFRVERPTINGRFNGSRCSETSSVSASLAGMMCCPLETLGIFMSSVQMGQQWYHLCRWLGEGTTSNVYAVNVQNVECAVKVAKPGHSISMDVINLEKLKDIKGIPTIVMSASPSILFIAPVG